MSQHHADTLSPDRAGIDEALFSGQPGFRMPPDVPDLPAPTPDMLACGTLDTDGPLADAAIPSYETHDEPPPSAVAVQCAGGSYTLAENAPGVFELRPPAPAPTEPVVDAAPTAEPAPEPVTEPAPAAPAPLALTLGPVTGFSVLPGESAAVGPEQITVTGAAPAVIDLMLLSPPAHGTLLRDGFALTGGDAFTQEDVNAGRITYRHEGDAPGADAFSFGTSDGEIPATEVGVTIAPPPHQAPVADGPGSLASIREGMSVSAILGAAGMGIAVVSAVGRGQWEQRADDSAEWAPLGETQHGKALLLPAGASLRFTPRKAWAGNAKLTYRLWDGSSGTAGEQVNLAARLSVGGNTAFSANAVTASAAIEPAPEDERPLPPAPWQAQPAAGDLTGDGLAVVRLQGEGEWQFSLDGGRTWRGLGPVYHGKARVLRPGDKVRFVPRRGGAGRVALSGRPWDGRGTVAGATVCLAGKGSVGDETPFGETVQTWAWHLDGV